MTDSNFSARFLAGYRALLLVSKGMSEREAVSKVVVTNRRLASQKGEILSLVSQTVAQLDLLDKLIVKSFPGEEFVIDGLSLLRLVTMLLLQIRRKADVKDMERELRTVVPDRYRVKVELLIGNLLALGTDFSYYGLRDTERVALLTHQPAWWVEYCLRVFGRSEGISLLSDNPRPRYVRVNPLKNRGRLSLPRNAQARVKTILNATKVPNVYSISGPPSSISTFFSEGLFQMQDLASFLAVKAADPRPGDNVLELCAAPGAKTAAVAQLMKNRGRIVSVDYSRSRMRVWRREISRLGVKIAQPVIAEATRLGLHERFDLVIVDPPCTGTGVLDRNPSMKWRLSSKSLERYSTLQRNILESAAGSLDGNGRIMYCTCSLTVEENELVVSTFLKWHPEFETRPVLTNYGTPGLRGLSDCRRFYPHRDRTAGYFIALMKQVS